MCILNPDLGRAESLGRSNRVRAQDRQSLTSFGGLFFRPFWRGSGDPSIAPHRDIRTIDHLNT